MQDAAQRTPRLRLAAAALLILLLGTTGAVASFSAPGSAAPAAVSSGTMEADFGRLINAERTRRGLPAMQLDGALAGTSRTWSAHMASVNKLYHDPHLAARVASVEPAWRSAGENVGVGYGVASLHDAFMASTGHRANILSSRFNRVGVGVVVSNGKIWVTVRFLEGPLLASSASTSSAPAPVTGGDRTAIVGDFNGDGDDDVLVYGPGSAPDELWFSRRDGTFARHDVKVSGAYRPVAGDFNGDGRDEIFWYGVGTRKDSIWRWLGNRWSHHAASVSGTYTPVAGDWDGDHRDDIAWYGVGTRPDRLWYGTGRLGSFTPHHWSVNGTYRVAGGDLDGDGRDDLVFHGPGSAIDVLTFGLGSRGFSSVHVTVNGSYTPVVSDLSGDGKADIVWYGKRSNPDNISYMEGPRGRWSTTPASVNGTYLPEAGDFDADGLGEVLWYSPTSVSGDPIWWGREGVSPASRPLSR